MHPHGNDDDARTGAPSGLCFPRATYILVAAAYRLEDISDMLDPKNNAVERGEAAPPRRSRATDRELGVC